MSSSSAVGYVSETETQPLLDVEDPPEVTNAGRGNGGRAGIIPPWLLTCLAYCFTLPGEANAGDGENLRGKNGGTGRENDGGEENERDTNGGTGRDNDRQGGTIRGGFQDFLSNLFCFTKPGPTGEANDGEEGNERVRNGGTGRDIDEENERATNGGTGRDIDEENERVRNGGNGRVNNGRAGTISQSFNIAGDETNERETNGSSGEWKIFVERSNKMIQWVIGTAFLFVPANFLIEGGGEDKADDDKKPVNLVMALFEEVKTKFPKFFLPTMMGYVGFYVGSLWFKKPRFRKTIEVFGILCGCVSVVEILYYVGFEASKFAAAGFFVVFFVLIVGKSIEYFC